MKGYVNIFTCILICDFLCPPCFTFFGNENSPPAQEDLRTLHKKYQDLLCGLMERRHIRVLIAFNKTNFFISNGGLYGFEYALLKDYEKCPNKSASIP